MGIRVMLPLLMAATMSGAPATADAQRKTDLLDRGLVAMKNGSNVYVSWRVQPDEYYGVTYNLYCNGSKIASNLQTSNYLHQGSSGGTYKVVPVMFGQEVSMATENRGFNREATTWNQNYFEIPMANVQAMNGVTVWKPGGTNNMADYTINDVALGDIDGDGKMDFIVKRKNQTDQNNLFPTNNYQMYCHIEAYASSINYGRLWWIDCGPNMCYGADEQWDAVAFDWNQDGKCEVLYRGTANTVLHHSDGTTRVIGNASENIRGGITHTANMTFTNAGEEWLMLIDGSNGKAYDVISYPLPRGNASDWGDGYGHRSSKYFMGAPYLDGKNPFIFLGRGIYTKIDCCTYRVVNNKFQKVGNTWHSYNNAGWYGQGNHNYNIADVDEDGRDEIVYGSMVLDWHDADQSLHGMSSTSLGHGDAIHTGDLDPFRKGLETFACNEDHPGNNFRNAATCQIYSRTTAGGDDGRAMAGNFTNEYPGGIGASTSSGIVPLSYVQPNPNSPTYIDGWVNNWNANTPNPIALNFRIYWDGDLLSETINGPGSSEGYLYVDKLGSRIFDTGHGNYETSCINGTKKNPCATGDIFGDWREEIVMRTADNTKLRIYTTNVPTDNRMQSLWYDHQYRQAMVWQTEGYNQPPHPSFFVGEMEGLTQAPPALTNEGRNGTYSDQIRGSLINGKDVMICPNGNGQEITATILTNAQPRTLYLVSNTTIEGGDRVAYTETKHTYDRITLNGAGLSGATNLCKQGDAAAVLPYATSTHSGKTDVWAGALVAAASITNSPIWANRFTELYLGNSAEGATYKSIATEYGSQIQITDHSISVPYPGNTGYGNMTVGNLSIKEGSRVVFDINGSGNANGDKMNIGTINIRKVNWKYGPQYLAPVFQFASKSALEDGYYLLGTLDAVASGSDLKNIIIECNAKNASSAKSIVWDKNTKKYYLLIGDGTSVTTVNVFAQNYEGNDWADGWVIGNTGRLSANKQSRATGGNAIWLKQACDLNNGTNATYTFPESNDVNNAKEYVFEFDFAQTSICENSATRFGLFQLKAADGSVLAEFRAGKWSNTGQVMVGGSQVATYSVTPGAKSTIVTMPTLFHHVVVKAVRGGKTTMQIDGGAAITLSNSYVPVKTIYYDTNRYAGQMMYDNFLVTCKIETSIGMMSIDIDEDMEDEEVATEVEVVEAAPVVKATEGKRFTIYGTEAGRGHKGITIINGKKYFLK